MVTISWSTESVQRLDNGDLVADTAENVLQFDAVLSQAPEFSATLTEHAVEDGANQNDHKIVNPRRIVLEGYVTNQPTGAPLPSGGGESSNVGSRRDKAQNVPGTVLIFERTFNRIQDVFDALRRLVESDQIVTIVTADYAFTSMQLTSFTAPRNRPIDGRRFVVEAQSYRVATTNLVEAPEPREPRGRRAANAGAQEANEATDQAERRQSFLSNVEENGFGEALSSLLGGDDG